MKNWQAEFRRLDGAYAASTMRSYFADVERYETWCRAEGLEAFPCSVETLCRFIEADALRASPATVRRRIYAIRKVHRLLGLPDPTQDEDVNLALRRMRRLRPIDFARFRLVTRLREDLHCLMEVLHGGWWGWVCRAV